MFIRKKKYLELVEDIEQLNESIKELKDNQNLNQNFLEVLDNRLDCNINHNQMRYENLKKGIDSLKYIIKYGEGVHIEYKINSNGINDVKEKITFYFNDTNSIESKFVTTEDIIGNYTIVFYKYLGNYTYKFYGVKNNLISSYRNTGDKEIIKVVIDIRDCSSKVFYDTIGSNLYKALEKDCVKVELEEAKLYY